jgi:hypothetical protein
MTTTNEGGDMGRIVVTEFVSMDGVMEAPGGEEGYKHTALCSSVISFG